MSTPAMAFTQYLKWMLMGFWLVWLTTLVVSRIFIFHEAYTTHTAKVVDEQWLAEQCKTPEFYSNIRQHTDLCEAVYANYRASPFLVGLNAMAVNTYACGSRPCTEVLQSAFVKMGWQMVGVAILLALFAPNLLLLLYKSCSGGALTAQESAIFRKMEQSPYYCQDLQTSSESDLKGMWGMRHRKILDGNEVRMV
jgi:hypothetical protein